MKNIRLIAGVAIWVIVIVGTIGWSRRTMDDASRDAVGDISTFLFRKRQSVELKLEHPRLVLPGDAIFRWNGERFDRIGEVIETPGSSRSNPMLVDTVAAVFYSSQQGVQDNHHLIYFPTSESMGWVLQTMLPPETRDAIAEMIVDAFELHREEILDELRPIVEASLREAAVVVRDDLNQAIADRQDRLKKIGDRYEAEVIQKELVPLIEKEILPIVQKHAKPLLNEIGEEIWKEASLFRFGWRVIYDASPLPQRDLTKREFKRFVEKDALPILRNHTDDFIEIQETIFKEIARSQKVRQVIGDNLKKLVNDKEVQGIVLEVFREVIVENPRLREIFEKQWNSEAAQTALRITNDRLQPTITAIGELLFGNPFEKITPEFSRVVREKILRKDSRWFLIVEDDSVKPTGLAKSMRVEIGESTTLNPFHVPVGSRGD